MAAKMPVLFISHGPPTILMMESPGSTFLKKLPMLIPEPSYILCISAHFDTRNPTITSAASPGLIYDFGGPDLLFDEAYPAPGSPDLAQQTVELLKQAGFKAGLDENRGLDHGAWIPLKLMYPNANIPVIQISLQTDMSTRHHYDIGKALQPLREQGVLILGSGGAVHNLYELRNFKLNDPPPEYVKAFDTWLYKAVTTGHHELLTCYKELAPDSEKSHPYPGEHFLPLMVCLGATPHDKKGSLLHADFMYGTLSMASYCWD